MNFFKTQPTQPTPNSLVELIQKKLKDMDDNRKSFNDKIMGNLGQIDSLIDENNNKIQETKTQLNNPQLDPKEKQNLEQKIAALQSQIDEAKTAIINIPIDKYNDKQIDAKVTEILNKLTPDAQGFEHLYQGGYVYTKHKSSHARSRARTRSRSGKHGGRGRRRRGRRTRYRKSRG